MKGTAKKMCCSTQHEKATKQNAMSNEAKYNAKCKAHRRDNGAAAPNTNEQRSKMQ